ncbi:hypothetical protein CONLIGDRAFT_125527 [Coniochaeta ligniaria NRRL 30616]|uniref:Uncharacterized protein n=1 Tax=Coniochaeta ligniaria NRRL 30616 TaxID=1408157 RepID=A0A1J7I9G1_9PEZI|nr:hypothetical protein CONLIGDRAFT_125527 [Coniochaeta ligniaria NRRL 30616]
MELGNSKTPGRFQGQAAPKRARQSGRSGTSLLRPGLLSQKQNKKTKENKKKTQKKNTKKKKRKNFGTPHKSQQKGGGTTRVRPPKTHREGGHGDEKGK